LELKKFDSDWSYAYAVYEKALRLLHPLMPFLTEELWHRLEMPGKSIALAKYPQYEPGPQDAPVEMALLQDTVTEIRQERAANKIDKSQALTAVIKAQSPEYEQLQANKPAIERLANVTLAIEQGPHALKLNIPVDRARLEKEIHQLSGVIAGLTRQLESQEFLSKAPEKVVASMRQKVAEYEAQIAKNRAAL
jgi:valyl-tRNA synthetase